MHPADPALSPLWVLPFAALLLSIAILPLFIHYEAQEEFEWRDPQTLLHKLWHFVTARNNRANYYVYDAINPQQFADKDAYAAYVHALYQQWQAQYLE